MTTPVSKTAQQLDPQLIEPSPIQKLAQDLKVMRIDVLMLMGPSGVGKSTALRLLSDRLHAGSLSIDTLIQKRGLNESTITDYVAKHLKEYSRSDGLCSIVIDSNDDPNLWKASFENSDKTVRFIYLYRPLDALVSGFFERMRSPVKQLRPLGGIGFCLESFMRFFPLKSASQTTSFAPITPEVMQSVRATLKEIEAACSDKGKYYYTSQVQALETAFQEGRIYPTPVEEAVAIDISSCNLQGAHKTSEEDLSGDLFDLIQLLRS